MMITLRIDYQAHLGPLSELPGQAATPIRDWLSSPNPAHQEAEKRGFYNGNIPQEINKLMSTFFLTTLIKFSGRLLQYLGRVLRPAPGKDKARVFDYLDPVGVLQAAARARQRVYGGD